MKESSDSGSKTLIRSEYRHSEEVKRKISEAKKKFYSNLENLENLSEFIKIAWRNPKTGVKMREAQRTPEIRERRSNITKKLCPTKRPEVRRKIGEANKRIWKDPNQRARRCQKIKEARVKQVIPFFDTSIEKKLQIELTNREISFKTHYPIFGQPDIFIEPNICIFADGCYWHKCPIHHPKASVKENNDEKVNCQLRIAGYKVLRFWEHQINNNIDLCLQEIEKLIGGQKL